ncbi:MAG: DEAD/DEAH box helicase family protein [Bacteroidaceae bacterium]|nr:DEAD/DEAH box helicase family protein [Bacteroidaceae bacterium]
MKRDKIEFQDKAIAELRKRLHQAQIMYRSSKESQIVPFTAPTGSGKTIMISTVIENILCGGDDYVAAPDSIILWLSDSPSLNNQSKDKLETKADRLRIGQCVTIDDSFKADCLQQGHVYFVNTQKFGKNSNFVQYKDERQYTGWDVLRNTIERHGDKLILIIDEAHRGAGRNEANEQMTIMQKFVKGSKDDNLPQMPIILGMSATLERFNKLIEGCDSAKQKTTVVTPEEVRESGLLKDKIQIFHPEEEGFLEMSYLAKAAEEWKDKCIHWAKYKEHEPDREVKPVLVVQVQNANKEQVSDTDLDECLRQIETHAGVKLQTGEVVHTFEQHSTYPVNGIDVVYSRPEDIEGNQKIRVVLFKDNLSTGWDCPRAEVMMSFKVAKGYTNIAQLFGRIVRTPLQKRIETDETLNAVRLYLPHFDVATVEKVRKELQGALPVDVETNPTPKKVLTPEGKLPCGIEREDVLNALNEAGIDTYAIPHSGINNYMKALFKLCHLLRRTKLNRMALDEVKECIAGMIYYNVKELVNEGKYDAAILRIRQHVMNEIDMDAMGESLEGEEKDTALLTDYDIERWFEHTEAKLASEGIGKHYHKEHDGEYLDTEIRLHVIMFATSKICMEQLDGYCKETFYKLVKRHRKDIENSGEANARDFRNIVNAEVSTEPYSWLLPDLIVAAQNENDVLSNDHLYCDGDGNARFKLNTWEVAVLEEERKREDFVCWMRNTPSKKESLCIQYRKNNQLKPHFPDFIIVRKSADGNWHFDVLEPHRADLNDNLQKARGMADYSKRCSTIERNELIRVVEKNGIKELLWLDLTDGLVANELNSINTDDELTNLFAKFN